MERPVTESGEIPSCPISASNHIIRCPQCTHYDGIRMEEGRPYLPAIVVCGAGDTLDGGPG